MRRESVVVSTKFGILPAQTSFLRDGEATGAESTTDDAECAKGSAAADWRAVFGEQLYGEGATRECRDESAKAGDGLRGSVVHELGSAERAPAGGPVCRNADDGGPGKVRLGISAEPEVVEVALGPNPEGAKVFSVSLQSF
jgi:hypothetical protein